MFKLVVVLSAAVATCVAVPQGPAQGPPQGPPQGSPQGPPPGQAQPVQILKQDSTVSLDGYNFDFETSDGTSRHEEGELKTINDTQAISVKGSYQYLAPDGEQIVVNFVADENGFKPQIQGSSSQASQTPQ